MSELAAISLFSGAGGLDLGVECVPQCGDSVRLAGRSDGVCVGGVGADRLIGRRVSTGVKDIGGLRSWLGHTRALGGHRFVDRLGSSPGRGLALLPCERLGLAG